MKKRSKRYRTSKALMRGEKRHEIEVGVDLLKQMPAAKFDETVEISLKLGIDARKSDQLVRGSYVLPHGIGKEKRVIVFAQGELADEAKAAGAMEVGGPELAKRIEEGWQDFDVVIASPDMMRFVGKLGRILGPQGKMPSPKTGTVTTDVGRTVQEFRAGKIEYRTDSAGNVHAPMGRKSFPKEHLIENINAFIEHIKANRPSAAKGTFLQKAAIATTMSPGIGLVLK